MRILVTGAGGFIGSHLVERLVKEGHRVTAFLRYISRADTGNLEEPNCEIIYGDIRNRDDVMRAMQGCTHVVHMAAQIAIPYSYISSADFVTTNVVGTHNVLMAAKLLGVKRLVNLSTSEVYGTAQYFPMDEAHPLVAQSPYAASKIGAEKMCEAFYRTYGMPVVIVRPFNTYGPRQSGRAVIPSIIMQAMDGGYVKLANFFCQRDFNYVHDTVDSLVRIIQSKKGCGETFNLATGAAYSLVDVVELVGKIFKKPLRPVVDKERERPKDSEVLLLKGSMGSAFRTFGCKHDTSLEIGLTETIQWFRDYRPQGRRESYTI
jgi:dTDP-glucose 4,6-dehydratase